MPAPPVKPTRPSMISDLRCVRLLKRPIVYQWIGLYQAIWQPPDSRISRMSSPMLLEPIASSRIFTLTPARAFSASACANVRPISPSQ